MFNLESFIYINAVNFHRSIKLCVTFINQHKSMLRYIKKKLKKNLALKISIPFHLILKFTKY